MEYEINKNNKVYKYKFNEGEQYPFVGIYIDNEYWGSPQGDRFFVHLLERIVEYEKALQFYADESNWDPKYDHILGFQVSKMDFDEGAVARKALDIELEEE